MQHRQATLHLMQTEGLPLRLLPDELRGDREIVLAAVRNNGYELQYAAEELKKDRDIVLTAVAQNGEALRYAAEELQKDREIVLAAVTQNGEALQFAARELKRDREIVLTAVTQNGFALYVAEEELKKDREIVLTAVTQNVGALDYAAEELKKDREIVLTAVTQDGFALAFAAEELQKDREIVLEAVRRNGFALQFAREELKGDRDIVLAAVRNKGSMLYAATEELQKDREIVLAAVRNDGRALRSAAEELKGDREIVLTAVRNDGRALQSAAEELKGDREIVLAAVRKDGMALQYAAEELKTNVPFIMEIAKENLRVLNFVSNEVKNELSEMKEFQDLILEAAKNIDMFQEIAKTNEFVMKHAPENLKTNVPFIMEVAKENLRIINYVSNEVKDELSGIKEFKDLILKAAKDTNILRDLQIVSLDLSNMNMSNNDLVVLSQKLKDNTNIRQINLEFNEITNQGLFYLQVFLLQTRDMTGDYNIPNLRLLRLGGNFLGEVAEFLVPDIIRQRHMDIELLPLNPKNKVLYSKIEEKFKLNTDAKDLEKYLTQHFSLQELTQFVKDGGILSHFKANKEIYRKIYSDVSDKDFKNIFNFGENVKQKKQNQYDNEPTSSSSSTSRTILQQRQIQNDNEPTSSSSSSRSHSTSQYLNIMKDATSSSQKTIYPKTKEEIIEILKSQYNIVLTILSNLNQKAIEKNVQAKIKEIKEMFPNISTTEQSQLEQIFQKNLKEKKDLYFQTPGNQKILRKYKIEQFRDVYTDGPISTLNIHKKHGHFIDQSSKQKVVDHDQYYTKQQVLGEMQTASREQIEKLNEEQVKNLLPILRKFKDFESTKLLQKERQQRQKIKREQDHQQKGEEDHQQKGEQEKQSRQIMQIKNSLARIQEAQKNIKLKLLEKKELLRNELQKKKKQMEQNKTTTHDPQEQIQKPPVIQQLQNRISNIQGTLFIISNEMSRQG